MNNLFDELKTNKLFWAVVALTVFNVGVIFVGKFVVDKAADKVIERFEKDYSPSPYGPGIDPDKVDPTAEARQRLYYELKKIEQQDGHTVAFDEEPAGSGDETWRATWESERGFSP